MNIMFGRNVVMCENEHELYLELIDVLHTAVDRVQKYIGTLDDEQYTDTIEHIEDMTSEALVDAAQIESEIHGHRSTRHPH